MGSIAGLCIIKIYSISNLYQQLSVIIFQNYTKNEGAIASLAPGKATGNWGISPAWSSTFFSKLEGNIKSISRDRGGGSSIK